MIILNPNIESLKLEFCTTGLTTGESCVEMLYVAVSFGIEELGKIKSL